MEAPCAPSSNHHRCDSIHSLPSPSLPLYTIFYFPMPLAHSTTRTTTPQHPKTPTPPRLSSMSVTRSVSLPHFDCTLHP